LIFNILTRISNLNKSISNGSNKINDYLVKFLIYEFNFLLFLGFLTYTFIPTDNADFSVKETDVKFCPQCPEPSSWNNCTNFKQSRTIYYCDVSTNYQCASRVEELFCIPPNETQNYILREYKWNFKGNQYAWNLIFPKTLYEYYKNKPRPPTGDYSIYATDPYDDRLISQLANLFKNASKRNGFDEYETVNFVISFVQSLPYTSDNITTPFDEYPRYPIETLVDKGGDCEDLSILTAVLINELGYDAVLLEFPNHMAVGVKCEEGTYEDSNGNSFCYIETTGEGWEIGEIPDEYTGTEAILRHFIPKPIITVEFTSRSVNSSPFYVTYEINITVKNEGSATAENLKIWAGFDTTEEGKVYSQTREKTYNLKPGERLNSVGILSVPRGVYTRLHIIVSGDNFFPQEKVSDWFKA